MADLRNEAATAVGVPDGECAILSWGDVGPDPGRSVRGFGPQVSDIIKGLRGLAVSLGTENPVEV